MDLVKEYNDNTYFKSEKDLIESLTAVFNFGKINTAKKDKNTIENKEELNNLTIQFLENILKENLIQTTKEKLVVIQLLSELNYRNEILEYIKSNKLSIQSKEAAERLGKKFMSSK